MSFQKHLMVRLAVDRLGTKRPAQPKAGTSRPRLNYAPALRFKFRLAKATGTVPWVAWRQGWQRLIADVRYRVQR